MAPAFGAPDMVAPGEPMMMSPRVINTAAGSVRLFLRCL